MKSLVGETCQESTTGARFAARNVTGGLPCHTFIYTNWKQIFCKLQIICDITMFSFVRRDFIQKTLKSVQIPEWMSRTGGVDIQTIRCTDMPLSSPRWRGAYLMWQKLLMTCICSFGHEKVIEWDALNENGWAYFSELTHQWMTIAHIIITKA